MIVRGLADRRVAAGDHDTAVSEGCVRCALPGRATRGAGCACRPRPGPGSPAAGRETFRGGRSPRLRGGRGLTGGRGRGSGHICLQRLTGRGSLRICTATGSEQQHQRGKKDSRHGGWDEAALGEVVENGANPLLPERAPSQKHGTVYRPRATVRRRHGYGRMRDTQPAS